MEKIRPIAVRIKVADPALAEVHKLLYNEGASPEPAIILNTPARPPERVFSPRGEGDLPTVDTRPAAPSELNSSPSIESQPKPTPGGISRRAVLVTGVAAVGVAAVGGITWFLLTHTSSSTSGQTTGTTAGTKTTPTAQPSPASAPTRPIASTLAQDTFHRPDQTFGELPPMVTSGGVKQMSPQNLQLLEEWAKYTG